MTQTNSAVQFNIQSSEEPTRNILPLLHEVKHALHNLINIDEPTIIDLRSIPLAPGEEDKILSTLGHGEIRAHLEALGPTEIFETAYAGVWIVTHYNNENEVIGRFIEISKIPEILASQSEDITVAYKRLTSDLEHTEMEKPA